MSEALNRDQLTVFLSYGWNFMSSLDNLTKSEFDYAKTYSILACILAGEKIADEEDDQGNEVTERDQRIVVRRSSEQWEKCDIPCKRAKVNFHNIPMVYDAFDSHFHLDRASNKITGSATGVTIEAWLSQQMERPPTVPVNLKGGLLIFCDPDSYPDTIPFDGKWKVSVGLHPKAVASTPQKMKDKFWELVSNSRLSAVGEVGLDTSMKAGVVSLPLQKAFLLELCPVLKPTVPVVVHIRSNYTDLYSSHLYHQAFQIFKSNCSSSQKIVLHCFTGNLSTVKLWLSFFPSTYFGFTHLLTKFDQDQLTALRYIPEDRLLAETDSPYMPPKGIRINSPIYIGEVTEILAALRYTDLDTMATCTTRNAVALFGH